MAKMKWIKVDGMNAIAYNTVVDATLGTSTIKFVKINGYIPKQIQGYVDGFPVNLQLEKSVTVLKGTGKVTLTLSDVNGISVGDHVNIIRATNGLSIGVYPVESKDGVGKTITVIADETKFTNGVDTVMVVVYSFGDPFGSKYDALKGVELVDVEINIPEYRIMSFT